MNAMPPKDERGFRPIHGAGPRVRTDVVDVYIARAAEGEHQLLQLLRTREPLKGTWHPIMGHVEPGEHAVACAVREMHEEAGLAPDSTDLRGFWALEQVHPFYIPDIDQIVMSPRFCALVSPKWEPTINDEHAEHRWVAYEDVERDFLWPGQHASINEIVTSLLPDGRGETRDRLAIDPTSVEFA